MKPIKVFPRIILVMLAFFLMSCEGIQEKSVERTPPGFVKLSTVGDNIETGGLHYIINESQISFLDDNETCIYQTELTNDDFIITYENEFYIYQGKYLELAKIATDIKTVETKPEGFIQLNEGLRDLKNNLHYVLGKTEIWFLDADEICIYQTELNNSHLL
ncbi:hypothetical protein SDC9_187850 [bioreactor metagenome]|uniref:Uncharacterized protein n=1 Tax=bioreactor metagenome TaxID=1076179 RepID=A0A645HVW0_9ZZZZ